MARVCEESTGAARRKGTVSIPRTGTVQPIERAAKRIYGIPEFRFYAIADGIKQLLYGRAAGIGLPRHDPCSNPIPLFS